MKVWIEPPHLYDFFDWQRQLFSNCTHFRAGDVADIVTEVMLLVHLHDWC